MLGSQVSPSKESTVMMRSGSGSTWSVTYRSTSTSDRSVRSSRSDRIGLTTEIVPSPLPLPKPVPLPVSSPSDNPGTRVGTTTAAPSASAPTRRPVAAIGAVWPPSPDSTRPQRDTRSPESDATSTRKPAAASANQYQSSPSVASAAGTQ